MAEQSIVTSFQDGENVNGIVAENLWRDKDKKVSAIPPLNTNGIILQGIGDIFNRFGLQPITTPNVLIFQILAGVLVFQNTNDPNPNAPANTIIMNQVAIDAQTVTINFPTNPTQNLYLCAKLNQIPQDAYNTLLTAEILTAPLPVNDDPTILRLCLIFAVNSTTFSIAWDDNCAILWNVHSHFSTLQETSLATTKDSIALFYDTALMNPANPNNYLILNNPYIPYLRFDNPTNHFLIDRRDNVNFSQIQLPQTPGSAPEVYWSNNTNNQNRIVRILDISYTKNVNSDLITYSRIISNDTTGLNIGRCWGGCTLGNGISELEVGTPISFKLPISGAILKLDVGLQMDTVILTGGINLAIRYSSNQSFVISRTNNESINVWFDIEGEII